MEILELINHGSKQLKNRNINSHQLDSEILLSRVLNKTREELLINLNQRIEPKKIRDFHKLVLRRSFKEPIAYILKKKEFWSKSFLVNNNTLIPRPETELMVEKIVKIFKTKNISILESQKYLRNGIINRSYYIYAICEKKNKKHIGNIKIGPIRRIDGVSDLVTVIGDKNYWGKGLATQALKLIINKPYNCC